MIAECANPRCSKPFRYLHEGRLFVMPSSCHSRSREVGRANRVKYAWLCHGCAETLDIQFEEGEGFTVVPRGSAAEVRGAVPGGFSEVA
jgi:hypothetical protein